jgi:hypothetical protein
MTTPVLPVGVPVILAATAALAGALTAPAVAEPGAEGAAGTGGDFTGGRR